MKKKLVFLLTVVAVTMMMTVGVMAATIVASGDCGKNGDNLTWVLDSDGTLTISGKGEMADYDVDGYSCLVGSSYEQEVTKATIGNEVTSIGKSAFSYCKSLTSIVIPDSVTAIGDYAFANCDNLSSITIGKGLTSIGSHAFCYCTNLKSIYIPDSVTHIGKSAFSSCTGLESVTIENCLKEMDSSVFFGCENLSTLKIYGGTILDRVFNNKNNLKEVYLGKDIVSIGKYAFGDCDNLSSLTVLGGTINEFAFFLCPKLESLTLGNNVDSIGEGAFMECSALTSIKVPGSVASIGKLSFHKCSLLKTVEIEKGVKSIGEFAFQYCSELENLNIGNGLITIEKSAFVDCYGLKSVTMPKSVTKIGRSAFYTGKSLKDVYYGGTKSDWEKIEIDVANEDLKNANIHYSATPLIKITSHPESYTGDGKVTFKVVAEGDGLTYNWEYKKANGTQWYGISTSTKSTLTTTVTEAKSGYQYRCKITDANGEVVYSDPATITYGVSKPAAPVITSSTVASSGKNKITWDAVDGAEKYYIYCKESGGSYKYLTYRTSTSYTHTAGEPGVCYYYKIAAVNSAGKSDYSNVKYRTCDLARPVITTSNVASSGKIKISWDAVDGASKYYIYRRVGTSGDFTFLNSTTNTSYINTGTEAGTAYYYKVKAVHENTTANSALSAYSGRTCDLARPVVDITLSSKGKPKLTWDAVDGAEKYEIYRSTSKDSGYSLLATMTKTDCTHTGAKAGTTYYYKVKAIHSNANANSAYSYIDSITSE